MPSQRKVWMVVGSVWLVISAFTGAVPALAQEAASEPITEVQAVAWDTLPGSDWIAVGGFSASADYSQVQPFLTVRRAQDLSVVLDLTTNPNGHTGQILGLAWSPDGNYLVSGSSDGYLIVWNIRDPRYQPGEIVAKLQDQDNGNGRVAWSPDGKWIVCASGWGLTIWSASGDDYHKVDTIYSDAISPAWGRDSRWIATDGDVGAYLHPINENGTFDLSGTRRLGSSNYPYMTPRSVAWNTTGFQLGFSDVAAQKIHIYDVETNTEIQAIEFADYFAGEVDWSPDGTKIAYGASDKTVRVVDIASEQELGVYSTGKIGVVEKVAWSPDGRYLAFPQAGEIPMIVEIPTVAQEVEPEPITEVQAVAWDTLPSSDWIAVGGISASADYSQVQPFLTVRRAQDLSVVFDLTINPNGHTWLVFSLAWSPDGNYLVSGSPNGDLIVWNIRDPRYEAGEIVAKLQDRDNGNGRVAWSPDGKWIVCASGTALTIWNASENDYHKVDTIYSDAFNPTWGPDSRWVATDGPLGAYLYHINENGSFDLPETRRLGTPTYPYTTTSRGVAWNATGSQLVFSDVAAKKIRIYDVETNTEIQAINFADHFSDELDWSPDGTKIAYGASGKTVRVVDVASGQELGVYSTGKRGLVENVAWSPDGRYLAFPQAGEIPQIIEFAQTDT